MTVNGGMLRLARQRKGFQQGEAADRLGVAQATISRAENGLIQPAPETIERAVRLYEMPPSFFEQTDPIYGAPVSVHPMWRRKADVTGRDMDCIVSELNIRIMHVRRLLEAAEIDSEFSVPRLDIDEYGDPERIAALVRAHWKLPPGPIPNLTAAAERAGIIVVCSTLAGSAVSGVTFAVPGMPPLIILNEDQPADRQRFTLGHEIAHLVMHHFPSPTMENEANTFAGALLMPANEIRSHFVGRKVDLALLASLKPEWKVAMQSLLMRARSLGFVSSNQERYLWQQFSARRMRLREPPELDFPAEQPTTLNSMLKLHIEALGYELKDLEGLLHMRAEDISSFYDFDIKGSRSDGPALRLVR